MYKEIMCNYKLLLHAYKQAHALKTDDSFVISFDQNLIYNLDEILRKLESKDWGQVFRYYRFRLTIPKERSVDAMEFDGRIVQHMICDNILRPYLEPRLVKENCACREHKGTDYARNLIKQGLVNFYKHHERGYALKIDIKKYFNNIDKEILKQKLSRIADSEIRDMLYYIIDHTPAPQGLPIGNQTSQWFAIYYLDTIDRIVKEKYQIKCYARYMDDLIIIHEDKELLQQLLIELREVAKNQLHLEFNRKTQIIPLSRGFTFLGWRFKIGQNHKIILKLAQEKKQWRSAKIKQTKKMLADGKISPEKAQNILQSIRQYLSIGNTYGYIKSLGLI